MKNVTKANVVNLPNIKQDNHETNSNDYSVFLR